MAKFNFTLFLVLICSNVSQCQELIITPEGDTHLKAEGENIVFKCQVVNAMNQDAYIKWFDTLDEEIIESTGRVYVEIIDQVTRKLYITNIDEQYDRGTYTCQGQVEGNQRQMFVNLDVYKDITFDHAPTPQHPVEFKDGLIECRVSGTPTPAVSWRYRGDTIQTGGRYVVDTSYGLRIQNMTKEDDGLYECRAEDEMSGNMEKVDITVVVHRSPKITKELGTTVGVEHQQVAMECKAEGLPDPYYEFYRINEGGGLSRLSSTDTRFVDEQAGVVHYNPLTRDDQGEYLCIGINDAGEAQTEGFLDVVIPPKIYQYFNITQKEGLPTALTCLSEGEPSPNMTFRNVKNDYDYRNGENEGGRVIVRNTQSGRLELTIDKLIPEDTSNYTCKSHNSGGFAEQNGTIIVEFAPLFPEQDTEFYGWPGKTRNVTCHTYAEPAPSFQWWHNNRELENNETFRILPLIKDCVLQIYVREEDKQWIYGDFECRAKNAHGENPNWYSFQEATQPDAPKSAEVVEESPTMVIIEVVPPDDDGGMPIIGYRIEFESIHADFKLNEEMRIENLRPTSIYVFNVRVRNEVDVSNPFQFSHTMMDISAPHQIVIVSDPEGLYPYDYTLLWEKPLTGGIPIKEYRFRYRRVRMKDDGSLEIIDDWIIRYKEDDPDYPMSSYRLEGLKPNTHYQVEIEARNDIGWSDPSEEFIFHTTYDSLPIGGSANHLNNHQVLQYTSILVCAIITFII